MVTGIIKAVKIDTYYIDEYEITDIINDFIKKVDNISVFYRDPMISFEFENFVRENSEIQHEFTIYIDTDDVFHNFKLGYFEGNGVLIWTYNEPTDRTVDIFVFEMDNYEDVENEFKEFIRKVEEKVQEVYEEE